MASIVGAFPKLLLLVCMLYGYNGICVSSSSDTKNVTIHTEFTRMESPQSHSHGLRKLGLRSALKKLKDAFSGRKPLNEDPLNTECAICLSEIEPSKESFKCPKGHIQHAKCLFQWVLTSETSSCPLCRSTINKVKVTDEEYQYLLEYGRDLLKKSKVLKDEPEEIFEYLTSLSQLRKTSTLTFRYEERQFKVEPFTPQSQEKFMAAIKARHTNFLDFLKRAEDLSPVSNRLWNKSHRRFEPITQKFIDRFSL